MPLSTDLDELRRWILNLKIEKEKLENRIKMLETLLVESK